MGNKVTVQPQVSKITIFDNGDTVTLYDTRPQLVISSTGTPGPKGDKGDPGTSSFIKVSFTFTNTPSIIILSVVDGDCIVDSEIVIETPFDDPAATLSLGSVANNSLILSTIENRPTIADNYGNEENFKFAISEQIRLYINAGASTQGAGYILISKI